MDRKCENCEWWGGALAVRSSDECMMGFCQRYPPSFEFDETIQDNPFPILFNWRWCGEFKPKQKGGE